MEKELLTYFSDYLKEPVKLEDTWSSLELTDGDLVILLMNLEYKYNTEFYNVKSIKDVLEHLKHLNEL